MKHSDCFNKTVINKYFECFCLITVSFGSLLKEITRNLGGLRERRGMVLNMLNNNLCTD